MPIFDIESGLHELPTPMAVCRRNTHDRDGICRDGPSRKRRGLSFYDTEISPQGHTLTSILRPGPHAPPIVALDQDVDARARRGTTHEPILTDTAWATNLNTFAGRGGRLTFQAVSDPWFSAWDTTGYHGRLCEGQ
jgi:hypothetical protein